MHKCAKCFQVGKRYLFEILKALFIFLTLYPGGVHDAYGGRWLKQERSPGTAEGFLWTAAQWQTCWYQETHEVLWVGFLFLLLLTTQSVYTLCKCISDWRQEWGIKQFLIMLDTSHNFRIICKKYSHYFVTLYLTLRSTVQYRKYN